VTADLAHLVAEPADGREQTGILKVAKDLVAVPKSVDVTDLPVQHAGDEVTLVPLSGDRLDHLVEVEVGDKIPARRVLAGQSPRLVR
jgi:hypothetical protein